MGGGLSAVVISLVRWFLQMCVDVGPDLLTTSKLVMSFWNLLSHGDPREQQWQVSSDTLQGLVWWVNGSDSSEHTQPSGDTLLHSEW